jgi:hypothetical protein
MLKIAREREVKERRARKLEKKYAAAEERKAEAKRGLSPSATDMQQHRVDAP